MNRPIIHLVAGARPNFMKVAPLWRELTRQGRMTPVLVHTGQHSDPMMSDRIMRDLGLPGPGHHLGVGGGGHAEVTARVMVAYERLCLTHRPDMVVVAGDVNSTLAATLAAKKLNLTVAHLEAGLRSGDRTMPEEINRMATDSICDIHWTPSEDADQNLLREGVAPERIKRVGNIMIDSFEMLRDRIETAEPIPEADADFAVVTLHRPSNVDGKDRLAAVLSSLGEIAEGISLILPLHPRTRQAVEGFGLKAMLDHRNIRVTKPMGYIPFMAAVMRSRAVITDSGGVQEETSYLGIPCLTLRGNTERPVTIDLGTNQLVSPKTLTGAARQVLGNPKPGRPVIPLWDGKAAQRACGHLSEALA